MVLVQDGFSIGELARRTGLTSGVLRTWENRFGFPAGRRTASGHRRFTDRDVALVDRVLAERAAGIPLKLAVSRVTGPAQVSAESVFGVLCTSFPQLRPMRLSRRSLLAASRAVEDECLAQGRRPVVLGSFQTAAGYQRSEPRWLELSRTAEWCLVLADFQADPDAESGPVRAHLPADAPLRREWVVACSGAGFSGLVAAWEIPGEAAFEGLVSVDPAVARAAARVLAATAARRGTDVPSGVWQRLAEEAQVADPGAADRLLTRMLGYLDRHSPQRQLPRQ